MVLSGSQWLLSVCLLSWCCDAGVLRSVDPESELPTPLVIWSEEEIGKNMMEDMENKVLNATAGLCEILANDPKLQQGYIAVTFSKELQIL
ncbi:palmitoyl-protein thioesterase 1-like [Peromyscus leucopus]|uniref:palmitoyl-protein thioesterase 1-like n=1 Tax=Peromyscus leucopus TaxID=10041 RepID=UPI0010A17BDA|nr:palmitoyl-protein thioesterase 1-like [Peromyscus leucopus]